MTNALFTHITEIEVVNAMEAMITAIPNLLTLLRIFLLPCTVYAIYLKHYDFALGFVLISGITDWLDGFIARAFHAESQLGCYLDPLADKLTIMVLYLQLCSLGGISIFTTALIVGRDIGILGGVWYLRTTAVKLTISPSLISKINTALQLLLIYLVLGHLLYPQAIDPHIVTIVDIFVLGTTLYSGYDYFKTFQVLTRK